MATLNEEIGKLIARNLLTDQAVHLPEVGSLYTKRIAARRVSRRLMEPPHRRVEFSDSPVGHSLIEEIVREARCSEEQARDAYERWRTKATGEGRLIIEGVGTLCLKSLTPTEEFERRLNPQGRKPIPVRRQPMPWWAWTLITLSIIFLLFAGASYLFNPIELWEQWQSRTTERELQAVPSEEPLPIESEAAVTTEPADAIAPDPVPTTVTPASTPKPAPTDRGAEAIPATRAAHSYVVMGIYSTEANARRAVEQAVKRYGIPQSDFQLYRYDEKYLVSLGETVMRAEAQELARRYRSEYGASEVWVYSKVRRE